MKPKEHHETQSSDYVNRQTRDEETEVRRREGRMCVSQQPDCGDEGDERKDSANKTESFRSNGGGVWPHEAFKLAALLGGEGAESLVDQCQSGAQSRRAMAVTT